MRSLGIKVIESYGDFGADGITVEVKNSYADFNTGPLNWKLGVMGGAIGRSLVFDNDYAGAEVVYWGDEIIGGGCAVAGSRPMKPARKYTNKKDYDAVALETSFSIGEAGSIRPFGVYSWSKRFVGGDNINGVSGGFPDTANDANIYWLGLDADFTLGSVALYGSAAYSGGTLDGARWC